MKVKWFTEPNNFGDMLTPHILDHFGIPYEYTDNVKDADTLCVGSIARMAGPGVTVLGSGVIRSNESLNPQAIWKFVRGPLTRRAVIEQGGTCPEIYGDPALLLPLFCPESDKKYDVGMTPHYADYAHVKRKYSDQYQIINVVNKDPLAVAREITKCRRIISSSLHGIICADAYGIPTEHVTFSKLHGDGIKFLDHAAAMKRINLGPIIEIFQSL